MSSPRECKQPLETDFKNELFAFLLRQGIREEFQGHLKVPSLATKVIYSQFPFVSIIIAFEIDEFALAFV